MLGAYTCQEPSVSSVRSYSPACRLATLVKTAASSAHDNAMPTTETTVRTRFFLRDRSVNEVITLIV